MANPGRAGGVEPSRLLWADAQFSEAAGGRLQREQALFQRYVYQSTHRLCNYGCVLRVLEGKPTATTIRLASPPKSG